MLKKISSRKRSLILPFLALFYFVFGANAIHPYIHKNHLIDSITAKIHGVLWEHRPNKMSISSPAEGDEHSPCPICDYLALSSVLKSTIQHVCCNSYSHQQAVVMFEMCEQAAHPSILFIRGPPCSLFS